MAIHEETAVPGVIGYKMASFKTWDSHFWMNNADNRRDWSGLYVAPMRSIAKGYAEDYLNPITGSGEAYLFEVHLISESPVKVLYCDDAVIGNGSIPEAEKTALVREQLKDVGIDITGLLIPELGDLGYFFKCHHDKDNFEIIVPNMLAASLSLIPSGTYKYKKWDRIRLR